MTKSWQSASDSRMRKAQFLCSDMLGRLQRYENAEIANKKAQEDLDNKAKDRAKKEARKRIQDHARMIDRCKVAMVLIDDAVTRLEACLSKLVHERYARFADLQVCELRLKHREGRPDQENFKDNLHANLESEQKVLATCREEMMAREEQVTSKLEVLVPLRKDLAKDMATRRLIIEHEMTNLRPAKSSHKVKPGGSDCSLPKIADAKPADEAAGNVATPTQSTMSLDHSGGMEASTTSVHHHVDNEVSLKMITETEKLLDGVEEFMDKGDEAIKKSKRTSGVVTKAVENSLTARTRHLQELKSSLESRVLDVSYAIQTAERELHKYERRLEAGDAAKRSTLQSHRQVLAELEKTKADLIEDLRHKTRALNIDNTCRRVTPQVAASASQKEGRPSSASTKPGAESSPPSPSSPQPGGDAAG